MARSKVFHDARTTIRAWIEHRLATDQAVVLLDQAVSLPEQFADAEGRLVDIVEDLTVADTRRVLEYWRQSVDGPGIAAGQTEQAELRGISASKSMGGMIRLDGWMTTLAGEAVLAALHALMPPPALGDTRTPRQRRHDALEDLARDFLDHADTPTVGGEKPHVNVIIDWAALTGLAGGRHEFEEGEVIDLATVQRITCDSSVCRIVFGPNGEIIDVGRRTRVVPAALRRGSS